MTGISLFKPRVKFEFPIILWKNKEEKKGAEKGLTFVLMRIFTLQEYVSIALKYVLMEFINFRDAKRIFFSIGWLYRARTARKNRDIRRRRNVFLSPAQVYPTEYRQIHARIRETSELLNTSNAKEQLADLKEREEREKRICRPCDFGSRLRLDFARKFDISHSYVELISLVLLKYRESRPRGGI